MELTDRPYLEGEALPEKDLAFFRKLLALFRSEEVPVSLELHVEVESGDGEPAICIGGRTYIIRSLDRGGMHALSPARMVYPQARLQWSGGQQTTVVRQASAPVQLDLTDERLLIYWIKPGDNDSLRVLGQIELPAEG